MESEEQLREILEPFVTIFLPHLECDGATRVVSFLLDKKGIEFDVYVGSISHKDKSFSPHFWVETKKGTVFDFTAQKWIGVTWREAEYCKEQKAPLSDFIPSPIVLGALLW